MTPIVKTGGGGLHVYLAGEARNPTRILPGLDVRSTGGQVVAPPSRHLSGSVYEWICPPGPLASAPDWLAVARGDIPEDLLPPPNAPTLAELSSWASRRGRLAGPLRRALAGEAFAPQGQRDTTMAAMAGALARQWPRVPAETLAGFFAAGFSALGPDAPTLEKLIGRILEFQKKQGQDPEDDRPTITVDTDVEAMVDRAIEICVATEAGDLYSRGGRLTRVRPPEDLPDGVLRRPSSPAFELVGSATMTEILSHAIRWRKATKDGYRPVLPPPPVVQALAARGAWPGVRHAEGLAEGPILRPDGSIYSGGGYDAATGVLCTGEATQWAPRSLQESLDLFLEVVCDFPFAGAEHLGAWLASVLTAIGRTAFRGPSPLFLIDANVRGAGKSLLAELATALVSGRSPRRAALGADNDEDRKQITALAIEGARYILIDNIVGVFGTPKLCEALTLHDGVWSDRILGESTVWSGPLLATWWATANNIRLAPDMARRVCHIRLEINDAAPEKRTGFHRPELLQWAWENWLDLRKAGLSILYWTMKSSRQKLPAWGGYEGWSELVRSAVVLCGLPDPVITQESLCVADEETEQGAALYAGLRTLPEPMTPGAILAACLRPRDERVGDPQVRRSPGGARRDWRSTLRKTHLGSGTRAHLGSVPRSSDRGSHAPEVAVQALEGRCNSLKQTPADAR